MLKKFALEGLGALMNMVRDAAAGKITSMGAPRGRTAMLGSLSAHWEGQHTNPAANARRKAKKAVGGFRQFKKQQRAARAAFPEGNP